MPTQPDEIWDAIRAELRRETPDFQFHIWLEPLELAGIHGRTALRPRARAHPHVRRRALPPAAAPGGRGAASTPARPSRWSARTGSRPPPSRTGTEPPRAPAATPPGQTRPPQPEAHLRPVRDRRREPLRPRRRARRSPSCPGTPTTRSSSTGRPGSARRTCSTRSATTSSASDRASRSATPPSRSSRPSSSRRCAARRTDSFKQRFRGADVVLIDDIQFLAGREKTREEFFHTFNALLDGGRQLVMTSDRAPEDIPGVEDPADRALPLGARGRAGRPRARGAHGDPREARAGSTTSRSAATCWPRSPAASPPASAPSRAP